jgi:hypothetical protein
MLDNVIRTYVLNSDAKLHPLLAFVSVLGGLQSMGLWGVFIGPIIASCLHALVQIFNTELQELSHEKFGTKDDGPPEEETPENPESETVTEPDEAAGKESVGEDGNAPESKDNKASGTASRSAGKEPATNAEDKK